MDNVALVTERIRSIVHCKISYILKKISLLAIASLMISCGGAKNILSVKVPVSDREIISNDIANIKISGENRTVFLFITSQAEADIITFLRNNDTDGAFKKFEAINNQSINSIFNLAGGYYFTKKYNQAIQLYKQVIDREPKLVEAYNNLGASYGGAGDQVSALKYYNKALELDPKLSAAYHNIGVENKIYKN